MRKLFFFLLLPLISLLISTQAEALAALPTVRDCSIASLSGSSQSLLTAANYQRKYLFIQNTGTSNIGVNLQGGTAAIAGTGTITVAPGASLEYPIAADSNLIPSNIVTVIGTAAQSVTCLEGK